MGRLLKDAFHEDWKKRLTVAQRIERLETFSETLATAAKGTSSPTGIEGAPKEAWPENAGPTDAMRLRFRSSLKVEKIKIKRKKFKF